MPHSEQTIGRRTSAQLARPLAPIVLVLVAASPAAHAVDPGSQLIGCDQADTRLTITASSNLDPSCTWTRGAEIVASDVVLDCQGAHIAAPDRRYGILITAPTDVTLSNITIRNCHIEGFLNNIHIERDGFRDLTAGVEYDHAFSNILVEDSTSLNSRPDRWFNRRYGADDNVIEDNTFDGENVGVWVALRMGENTAPMECSDPAYIETALNRVVLDVADDNVIRDNVFTNVPFGIRVEDDGTVVEGNEFTSADAEHQAIVVGTRFRTPALGLPVANTTITGNRASIAGNGNPYRWVHGHAGTTFTDNQSGGRPVGFCEGVQWPTTPFIFVLAFAPGAPDDPPTDPGPVVAPPDPLPPCPLSCAAGGTVEKPVLALRRLDTPPGDDTLAFHGRVTLPHP